MKKITFLLTLFCLVSVINYACSTIITNKTTQMHSEKKIDRAQLVDLMDQYLAALVKHDPSLVPLASDVRLVENTKITPIDKGLWETSTGSGTTEYKIYVADPVMGQVGYMGLLEDQGKPVQIGVRLKLRNGEITEIDHMV
jgi:hypothetical protein